MELSVVPYGDKVSRGKADLEGGRYKECMRNHAAAMGRQAYDGCGEFMPAGEIGTLEALKCAACGCHRNFHRREDHFFAPPQPPPSFFLAPPPPPPTLLLPAPLPYRQLAPPLPAAATRDGSETPPSAAEMTSLQHMQGKKRFRTKFTVEQKEKMLAFAERVGWRIQRHDNGELEAFCGEVGVKRHAFKVWMHNNKHSHVSPPPTISSVAVAVAGDAKLPEQVSSPTAIHV